MISRSSIFLIFIVLIHCPMLLGQYCFDENSGFRKQSPGLEDYIPGCPAYDWSIPPPYPLSYYNSSLHLNVHLIPHTHDDIGWLKTVDQYYFGTQSSIQYAGVQYILDSIVSSLAFDYDRKFIYVEMGFFQRWWNEQKESTKLVFRGLLARGQLEFIGGGWCMNDEATVYYEDAIDQMTIGHQFLLNTFGITPQIGWHIDPFGHANAQAALYAQMGFKAFFFSRLDYQDKPNRLNNSAMEMVWQPNTSQGEENAIFTHVTYYHYSDPRGFCFDIRCNDDPIVDDPTVPEFNADQKSNEFVAWFRQMANSYRSSELIHTMGTDFSYQAANINFKNMERLINYINKNSTKYKANFFYSTPSTYINSVNKLNKTYPYKYDDFFPYADEQDAYWTGYFTSRVAMKILVKKVGKFTQAIKKLSTNLIWYNTSAYVRSNWSVVNDALTGLETAMATAQHHDAVTGTERELVAYDYEQHLNAAVENAKTKFVYPYLAEAAKHDLGYSGLQYSTCELNISSYFCNTTYINLPKGIPVLLTIYNPAPTKNETMRIKVPSGYVQTFDVLGNMIITDVICANTTDATDCDLFFTSSFNGYSLSYFYLKSSTLSNEIKASNLAFGIAYPINGNQSIIAKSLMDFQLKLSNTSNPFNFTLRYNYYQSQAYQSCGANSGAYIFRPTPNTQNGSIPYSTPSSGSFYLGRNLIVIRILADKTFTYMRIYNDVSLGIEIETFIQPLPNSWSSGTEVVILVNSSSIKSNSTFYTDSMGMEMQKRVRNYRATWPLYATQQVAGNYYPVQSAIYIEDNSTGFRLGLIPDRAQGGSSVVDGQLELMIHRRISQDDGRGLDEPLNELDWDGQGLRQFVTHKLFISGFAGINTDHRQIQYNIDQPNLVFLAPTNWTQFLDDVIVDLKDDSLDYIKMWSRAYSPTVISFRFQNLDEKQNRTVSTSFFQSSSYGKTKVTEMTLTFNQAKVDMIKNKLNWNGKKYNNPAYINNDYLTKDSFTLRPLEIRTFKVEIPAKETIDIEI